MEKIYLDYAATTPVKSEVLKEMLPYFGDIFGNANSQHTYGRDAAKAVTIAREQVAKAIGAKSNEVYFTSGGTEADNWAVKGAALALKDKGRHLITTEIEHSAIHASFEQLEKLGFEVTYLKPDADGIISVQTLKEAIRKDTVFISIMFANNEIGTIQPIKELANIAKENKILFHTDAVQALGSINLDVKDLGVDMMSISAHKIYGPKGIGALYIRGGIKFAKFMTGGEQERSMRGGTTNVPAVVGFGKAIELAVQNIGETKAIAELRDYFANQVLERIPYVKYNGHKTSRLANNANFSFKFIEGESLLFSLDLKGVCASSGSACSSGSLEPSRTLLAIGVPVGLAHGSIRFSLGKVTTKEQLDYTLEILVQEVERLRKMSPLFKPSSEDKKYV